MVVNSPHGKAVLAVFAWSSEDVEAGRGWLAKIEALGTVAMSTVAVTSVPDWMESLSGMVPPSVHGSSRTHSFRQVSDELTDIVAKSFENMPDDPVTMFTIHELRGPSAAPDEESVFASREPHFMFEILGTTLLEENREKSLAWADGLWKNLSLADNRNRLPGTYISLDHSIPGQVPLSKLYGSNAKDVVALKKEYDSGNVFDLAVPRLEDYI